MVMVAMVVGAERRVLCREPGLRLLAANSLPTTPRLLRRGLAALPLLP